MKNPYYPIETLVEDVIVETPTIKTFVLAPSRPIKFKAGQFMQLTVPGCGEAPFTPSSDPAVTEKMEISILRTGKVTDALHALKPGAEVGLRGPFGKGYPMEKMEGKEVLVVGGGVGLAPLRSLIYALLANPKKYKRISIKLRRAQARGAAASSASTTRGRRRRRTSTSRRRSTCRRPTGRGTSGS